MEMYIGLDIIYYSPLPIIITSEMIEIIDYDYELSLEN